VITRAPEVCLLGTATPDEPGIFDPVVKIKRERRRWRSSSSARCRIRAASPPRSPPVLGYVRHDERIEGVERAIMKARAGEAAVAPQLLQGAFSELLNPAAQPDDEGQRLLQMLTRGRWRSCQGRRRGDTRLIAAGMGIAPSTARPMSSGYDEAGGGVTAGGGGAGGADGTAGPGGTGAGSGPAREQHGGLRAED